jgi:hypothetical protein
VTGLKRVGVDLLAIAEPVHPGNCNPAERVERRLSFPFEVGHMTISLPYVWVWGHCAAPFGTALLLFHVFRPQRLVVMAGTLGGTVSCAFLGYVLFTLGIGFSGIHRFLAWPIAFCAGYVVAAPLGWLVLLFNRHRTLFATTR